MSPDRSSMDEQSGELTKLLLQSKRPSPVQVWNRLQREERVRAVRSRLRADSAARASMNSLLARALNYRVPTIAKWREDRLVARLAALQIRNARAVMDLLVHDQLAPDRPVAATLLDQLGIAHRDGRVDATEELDASEAAVRAAAESAVTEYGRRAVALCFLVYRLEHAPLGEKARAWLEPSETGDGSEAAPIPAPAGAETEQAGTSPSKGDPPTRRPAVERPASPPSVEPEPAAPPTVEPEPAAPPTVEPEPAAPLIVEPEPAAPPTVEPEPAAPPLVELSDPVGGPLGSDETAPPDAEASREPSSPPPAADPPIRTTSELAAEPPVTPTVAPVAPAPSVTPAKYEPEEDSTADAWLTTLDRLLQKAALDTWREITGALSPEDLDDAVDEFAALNGSRPHSQFHVGHRDALFCRDVHPATDVEDPSRLRWYWAGAITGFARRDAWGEIVRVHDENRVVRDFGGGNGPAATVAVRAVVDALHELGRSAELGDFVRQDAVTAVPELFETLQEAATDLLRAGKTAPALALYELLMNAADDMESAGDSPPPRALHDTRRRAAHCFRALHEHERARRLLVALLEQDDHPDRRAMMEADLGLLAGEFDSMEGVELPLREKDLDDFVGRLEKGEDHFKRSAIAGVPYSAHGNYLLGVLRLGRAVQTGPDANWRDPETHLQQARTHFRKRGKAYSPEFIARADFYFAIARAQRLRPEGLAHAAQVFAEAVRSGDRFPEYLVGPSLEAFTVADERDLRGVVSAMIGTGDERVLDELARSDEVLKNSRTLTDELWRRSTNGGRSAGERAADLRASLRGFMAQRRHDDARGALDRLEELAAEGIGFPEFLEILEAPDSVDPAWSREEALIARARCHEARGDFTRAVQVLRPSFFRALAQDSPWALHDAQGILERVRGYGIPRDEWRDLQDHYQAKAPGHDPAGRPARPGQVIRVLVVGAGEQLAKNEEQVRQQLKNTHPHIRVRFVRTGWSANWMPAFETFDRMKGSHQALVLMRFVRTNFGRRVRKAWPGDRPWRFCWGEGQRLLTRTIVRAAAAASTKTG